MTSDRSPDHSPYFTIRRARRKDIPGLARLALQLGYPDPIETIEMRFLRIHKDRRDHCIYVAVQSPPQTSIIGLIHVFIDKLLTTGPRVEVGGLVVDEEYRSRGVGAALLARAETWAHKRGFSPIIVRANIVRQQAHNFYEKCGYRLLKQSKVYTKEVG
jgi:GNAT superfamily N-acetyltransferase